MLKKWCLLFLLSSSPWMSEAIFADEPVDRTQIVEVESWLDKWAQGDKDVLTQFKQLEQSLQKGVEKKKLTESDVEKIHRAASFAAEKHQSQFRKNSKKTPYVIHVIGVADYVMSIGQVYDPDVIIAALLHDVMDGTGATYEEIATYFGLNVAKYIQEVTGDLTLSDKEQKKQQIIKAPHESKEVAIIRLADKLHNLKTLLKDPSSGWDQDRLDSYFQWVQAVVDHLPAVNAPLKDALHKTIAGYWEGQSE
ncbi:MAG: HD domain-containing protein [Verrucomicrobia bacterium]|nr:HD domain-containing protein [Verrucomicrobiota bacterium]